jgi:hypothetical protein
MKKTILCASIVSLLAAVAQAQNETITWGNPTAINSLSGASDVVTTGSYFGSWAPYDTGASSLPVNGVTFSTYGDLPDFAVTGFGSNYNDYNNPGTTSANYNALLQYGVYDGSGTGSGDTISWGGMTPGSTYEIQFWANDGRGNDRSETLIGGANTSATIDFGNSGEFITGTFVADSTGDETITLDGSASANGDYPQVNLFQVRDISAVPEPSTFAFLATGAGALICGLRRKSRIG